MKGTNKGHENAEGMALVGVRLTAQLGIFFPAIVIVQPSFSRLFRERLLRKDLSTHVNQ